VSSLRAAAVRFVLEDDVVTCAVLGPRSGLQLDQLVRDAGKAPPYLPEQALEALYLRLESVRATG
jgi:aryl-alcohol dehydrogenase-like predicted oxidoreductase